MDSKFCLIYVILLLLPLVSFEFDGGNVLTDSDSLSPSNNRTLVSPNHVFELGFFNLSPSGGDRWYLGIWYKSLDYFSGRTYVWVANRDHPLTISTGSLKFYGANLVIMDRSDTMLWSSGAIRGNARSPVVAELMSDGNFVVRYVNDSNNFLYQSFDYPTDTLLPGMILGLDSESKTANLNRSLTSWNSFDDPSSGVFTFKLEIQGSPGLSINKTQDRYYWSGPWDGDRFAKMPRIFNLTWTRQGEPTCMLMETNVSSYSRLLMADSGLLLHYTWDQSRVQWDLSWTATEELCDIYNYCGLNAYCDMNNVKSTCSCIKGYENTTDGCVRKTPLKCGESEFVPLLKMSFPFTINPIRTESTNEVEECKKMCIKDCKCSAFSITSSLQFTSSTCVTWRGDLADLRRYSNGGLDLYIKQDG